MLKMFRKVTEFYGNNTVFISDGENKWQEFPDHNFQIKHPHNNGDDMWITSGVVVAFGACCSQKEAIRQLKGLLKELRKEEARDKKSSTNRENSLGKAPFQYRPS